MANHTAGMLTSSTRMITKIGLNELPFLFNSYSLSVFAFVKHGQPLSGKRGGGFLKLADYKYNRRESSHAGKVSQRRRTGLCS
jgi:hypothetical protein